MHRHLRFLVSIAAIPSMAMFTTSCSSTPSPEATVPKITLKPGQIHYRLRIFATDEQLDVTNSFPGTARIAGIYSSDEGEKLLARLHEDKNYHLNASESLVGKKNQKVSYSNFINYRYPSEYTPAVYERPEESGSSFPVTPPTPSKIETKKLGTFVHLTGRKDSAETLSVSIKLEKTALLGNINHGKPITTDATDFWGRKVEVVLTENKQLVPVFQRIDLSSDITLRNGHFLLIEGSSGPAGSQQLDKSADPVTPPNFVALIQVNAAF